MYDVSAGLWSDQLAITGAADTIAPVISGLTLDCSAFQSCTVGFTTDEPEGTYYVGITTESSLTFAQCEAAPDGTGTVSASAVDHSFTVTESGYRRAYACQEDTAGNESNVLISSTEFFIEPTCITDDAHRDAYRSAHRSAHRAGTCAP